MEFRTVRYRATMTQITEGGSGHPRRKEGGGMSEDRRREWDGA